MARDKLITIRIEGDKRDAFNQLAKSQNTDTASLLYDFISGCLDSRIDISLVTGKGQRIDNQLDDDRLNKIDNRIDGIETTTQRLAKRLSDWIEAIDDRVTDCDQGLSNKITSLEHRLNALSSQLDSQKDSQKDRQEIDTDSQEIDDMEPLLKLQREASIADHSPDEPAIVPPNEPNAIEPIRPAIETVTPEVSPSPPGTDAIEDSEKKIMESVGEPDSIDTLAAGGTSPTDDQNAIESDPANPPVTEAIEPAIEDEDKPWLTLEELLLCDYQDWPTSIEGLRVKAKREAWTKRKRGKAYEYQAKLPHHE